jgi:lipopolysaccharide export system protein LptA
MHGIDDDILGTAGFVVRGLCLGVALWALAGSAVAQVPADSLPGPPPAAPVDSVQEEDVAADDTSETERVLVNADSLSALTRDGERIQELFDNVEVDQDTTRLRSEYGLRYLNRDELLFTGDVVIYERGDTLRADTVAYNKRTKVGRARSNVRLTDGDVVVRAPRAVYYTEEKRSVFPDSVTLVDSSRVLRAQWGTYFSPDQRAEFEGEVRLTDPQTYLEADSLTYYREQDRSIAVGNVFVRRAETEDASPADTTSRTYLFGDWVDNQQNNRYSETRGRALLLRVQLDSTGSPTDSLVVRGRRLEAFRTDQYRRLIAVDSVRIWQNNLAAVADSAVYDRVLATGETDSARAPRPLPASRTPPGADTVDGPERPTDSLVAPDGPMAVADSLAGGDARGGLPSKADSSRSDAEEARDTTEGPPPDSLATAERARSDSSRAAPDSLRDRPAAAGWERPTARSESALPLEESRLFGAPVTWFERSQVWGDSIRVRSHNRSLDTVFVRGAAFAAQQDTTLDRIQQLKGRNLTAHFRRDSLRRIVARPNAQAIRFLSTSEGALRGGARASGDSIVLHFRNGRMKRTSIKGGVESTYYRTPDAIPEPFRLDGFQWTPDRRPTRDGLLRAPRVRERLRLGPPRRPLARARAGPPDSTSTQAPSETTGSQTGVRPPGPSGSLPLPDSILEPPDTTGWIPRPPLDTTRTDAPRP